MNFTLLTATLLASTICHWKRHFTTHWLVRNFAKTKTGRKLAPLSPWVWHLGWTLWQLHFQALAAQIALWKRLWRRLMKRLQRPLLPLRHSLLSGDCTLCMNLRSLLTCATLRPKDSEFTFQTLAKDFQESPLELLWYHLKEHFQTAKHFAATVRRGLNPLTGQHFVSLRVALWSQLLWASTVARNANPLRELRTASGASTCQQSEPLCTDALCALTLLELWHCTTVHFRWHWELLHLEHCELEAGSKLLYLRPGLAQFFTCTFNHLTFTGHLFTCRLQEATCHFCSFWSHHFNINSNLRMRSIHYFGFDVSHFQHLSKTYPVDTA